MRGFGEIGLQAVWPSLAFFGADVYKVAPVEVNRYLDLLEDSLLGVNARQPDQVLVPLDRPQGVIRPFVQRQFKRRGWIISRWARPNLDPIEEGVIWPEIGFTMIGRARMRNIRECVESVIADGIPGDLIETGVWRGGACIYMRGILAAHDQDREVWVADSFAGLPEPHHPADAGADFHTYDTLAVSLDEVRENFARYRLLDDRVHFAKGWFRDTLPALCDRTWAVVRLDGDMYESTMDGLTNLYAGLSPGGYLIVDDYGDIPNCKRAVDDFRAENNISDPIETIDALGVFWRKS
jgi:O-methyltransferase